MGILPGIRVTGRTVTTGSEVLSGGVRDQTTVHIVTASTAVVSIQSGTGQGVIMTTTTSAATYGYQSCVARSVGCVETLPSPVWVWERDMAGRTITTASRNGRLQRRTDGMAVGAKAIMGGHNRSIYSRTSIVTAQARGGAAGNVIKGDVIYISVNSQVLVRVTVQTIGRVGRCNNRVNYFLTRTVVTGVTGTGAVGRDIMLSAFDLGPGRNHVTGTTESSRSLIGQISGTF